VAPAATQTNEGVTIAMNTTSGYPSVAGNVGTTNVTAADALMQAAGLATDYAGALQADGTLRVTPNNVSAATAANCFLTYTPATAANAVPTVALGANATADNCQ